MLIERFQEIQKILIAAVRNVYRDRLVALAVYGSYGRGTPGFNSDLDLLVIAEKLPAGRLKRMKEFQKVEIGLKGIRKTRSGEGIGIHLWFGWLSAGEIKRFRRE